MGGVLVLGLYLAPKRLGAGVREGFARRNWVQGGLKYTWRGGLFFSGAEICLKVMIVFV